MTALAVAALLLGRSTRAEGEAPPEPPERSGGQVARAVLLYLPNRLFDVCDIVRLHARVGTGFSVGARVTRYAPVFIGDYRAVWVGLPGPRLHPAVPLPVGVEGQKGLHVGPLRTSSVWRTPEYGVGEVGAGTMLYAVGFEVGVDPYELADFLAGFVGIDFAHDDF
ncbi:MAG: hypothetical protein ACREJT_06640 [Myxococcota bacterium]